MWDRKREREGDSAALHKLRSCKCLNECLPKISVIHFHFSLPPLSLPPPLTMHFQFSNFKRSTGRMINFIYLKANVQRSLPQLDCILSVVTGKWQVMASCNTLLPLAATQHNERMPRASSQRARLSAQMKSCGRWVTLPSNNWWIVRQRRAATVASSLNERATKHFLYMNHSFHLGGHFWADKKSIDLRLALVSFRNQI